MQGCDATCTRLVQNFNTGAVQRSTLAERAYGGKISIDRSIAMVNMYSSIKLPI